MSTEQELQAPLSAHAMGTDVERALASADSAVSRLLPIEAARSSAIAVGRTPREWRSNKGRPNCASSDAM